MEKQSFISRLSNKNEWARKEYRELKDRLATTYPFDRVSYTHAKAPFIRNILELARTQ